MSRDCVFCNISGRHTYGPASWLAKLRHQPEMWVPVCCYHSCFHGWHSQDTMIIKARDADENQ